MALRVLALIGGIAIVAKTAWSVFTALVVPRVTSSKAMRGVARFLGMLIRHISPRLPNYEARDRVLSLVGPAAMVLLFVVWLGFLVVGYGLIIWWGGSVGFGSAMTISGSSIFTLGIATGSVPVATTLEIIAAATGLLVVALEIAYLPALYGAFASRETEVTLLATRSGTPAWGPEILARHHFLKTMDELPELYADWERWAAAVSESHANYPALMWFRSPVSSRSWLLALVAMMDSAAMYHACSPQLAPRQSRLCLSMGTNCLRSMAGALDLPYQTDPKPDDGIRLTRAEFDEGYARLEGAGFPLERDNEDSWRHFAGWRINYEPIVDRLTRMVVPPPAPWFIARPELGATDWPVVRNRTPDDPDGVQTFGSSKTFKTPSDRESNNS
jgi:hypothetical protein